MKLLKMIFVAIAGLGLLGETATAARPHKAAHKGARKYTPVRFITAKRPVKKGRRVPPVMVVAAKKALPVHKPVKAPAKKVKAPYVPAKPAIHKAAPAVQRNKPAAQPAGVGQQNSLSGFGYRGASVLPYTDIHGQRYYLLAREVDGHYKGTYDAFGGSKDPHENHPVVTAGRELSEETVGLLGNPDQMRHHIDADNHNTSVVVANLNKRFAVYITHFDHGVLNNFARNFPGARAAAKQFKYREKDKLAWVRADVFENAIAHAPRDRQGKLLPLTMMADVIDAAGTRPERITLRPVFASCMQTHFNHGAYTAGKNPKIHFYQR